jgi:hypothetical protein
VANDQVSRGPSVMITRGALAGVSLGALEQLLVLACAWFELRAHTQQIGRRPEILKHRSLSR